MPVMTPNPPLSPHTALDPSFLGSFKRLFSQNSGCYLDIDMTRRVDWYSRRSVGGHSSSFLDQPATKPPTCQLTILAPELRALVLQSISQSPPPDILSGGSSSHSNSLEEEGEERKYVDKDIYTLHIRQTRVITVRDVLSSLDRFLYAEVPASYWPEDPQLQERIECAHRLRVKHLARTHGKSARAGARMSMSIMHSSGKEGLRQAQLAPLCFMQVVECAEVDEQGRMVKRDRKVAPRIDWLGGKFFFAGLTRKRGSASMKMKMRTGAGREEREADFVLNMEAPWARRRRSLN